MLTKTARRMAMAIAKAMSTPKAMFENICIFGLVGVASHMGS